MYNVHVAPFSVLTPCKACIQIQIYDTSSSRQLFIDYLVTIFLTTRLTVETAMNESFFLMMDLSLVKKGCTPVKYFEENIFSFQC